MLLLEFGFLQCNCPDMGFATVRETGSVDGQGQSRVLGLDRIV